MAAVPKGFFEGHPERNKDGKFIYSIECVSVQTGRLSAKELTAPITLVFVENALYEFKGSAPLKGKETRRYTWQELYVVFLNADKESRFVLGFSDNTAKTFDAINATTRILLVQAMKEVVLNLKLETLFPVLPDAHILKILKVVSAKKSPNKNVWQSLLNKDVIEDRTPASVTKLSREEIESGSLAGNGDRVGTSVLGPMTLVWRRLENTLQPSLTAPITPDDNLAVEIVDKMKASLESTVSPFSPIGYPKDAPDAMISLASVLMNQSSCQSFVKLFASSKGSAFLASLESNLACGDQLVRRWTALSLTVSLPIFAEDGVLPNTPGWSHALNDYFEQNRRRENAALRYLFPTSQKKTMEGEESTGEGLLLLSSDKMGGSEKASGRGKLKVMTKTNMVATNNQISMEPRKASILSSMTFGVLNGATSSGAGGGNTNDSEDFSGSEGGDRKLKGSLGLMWLSSLLELEASSSKEEGIKKSDIQTMFQILVGKYPEPLVHEEYCRSIEFEVETFGASVEVPDFLPPLISTLTATKSDELRCSALKQVNVLIMRNNGAIRSFLSIPDWQSLMFGVLYNVPLKAADRTPAQDDIVSYSLHLITTLHLAVLGSKSTVNEFGPIDKLMGQTIYKVAVHCGWADPAIAVIRSIFKGIFSSLSKQATSPTCTWRHNPMHDEWEEIFRLSHLLQTFLFYRPANMGMKDVPILVADASVKAARCEDIKPTSDWRARIGFKPMLNRIQNERLIGAHRQMYAKLGLPVMTATHRGEETGIHIDENGACHDRALADIAIKLWGALGVTGNQKADEKKSEEHMNKSDRSRIMYASNVCRELLEVVRLFDVIDEKRAHVMAGKNTGLKKKAVTKTTTPNKSESSAAITTAKETSNKVDVPATTSTDNPSEQISTAQKDQVLAIAQSKATDFLQKQKNKDQNVGFLSKAKNKNAAGSNLRSNMLQKREVAIRKLGSGSDKLVPQVASTGTVNPSSAGKTSADTPTHRTPIETKLHIRADDVVAPSPSSFSATPPLPSSSSTGTAVVATTTTINETEEKTIFELAIDSSKKNSEMGQASRQTTMIQRKTLVRLRKTGAFNSDISSIPSPPTSTTSNLIEGSMVTTNGSNSTDEMKSIIPFTTKNRKRSRAPTCHGCGLIVEEEIEEVNKFGNFWHAECLVCSNCDRSILMVDEEKDVLATCKFFPISEILVCSYDCQEAVLARQGDARCAGCLDGFGANEKSISACGYLWHVESQCFRCCNCDIRFDESIKYFEIKRRPYCEKCTNTLFLHCKLCAKPLLDDDKVVETADATQYHETCFICTVCKVPLGDNNCYSGKQGELLCFNHYISKRSPPCALCHLPLNHKQHALEEPVSIAGLKFHRACYNCSKCSRKLLPNAEPGSDDCGNEHGGLLFCAGCYAEEYGLKCRGCNKAIRGDVLHAGIGGKGEQINWHPGCFKCDECSCALLEVPFFLITIGIHDIVVVCFDHYTSRYANRHCPGCDNFVSPGRSNLLSNADESSEISPPNGAGEDGPRAISQSVAITPFDNPAVMYEEKMWHARCLTCDEANCNASLYEEYAFSGEKVFRIDIVGGKKYCAEHFDEHLDHCFSCKLGIREQDPRADLMGWAFHDTLTCFHCFKCDGPIEPGQALMKSENGPIHQECPKERRKTGIFGKLKEKRQSFRLKT